MEVKMISPIRTKRFFTQISIYDLSIRTGIDPARISLIERGYKIPRADEKEKIARALGCEIEDIFPLRTIKDQFVESAGRGGQGL